jgi:glycosyltransferase involved in cell wall biosynthesis
MGLYWSWVRDRLEGKDPLEGGDRPFLVRLRRGLSWAFPRPLRPERTIVVAEFCPSRRLLEKHLGGMPARVALPFMPDSPLAGVAYAPLEMHNPWQWGAETDALVPGQIDTVAVFIPWAYVAGKTLLHWRRLGIRQCWFLRDGFGVGLPPLWGAASKFYKALRRRWRKPAETELPMESCRTFLQTLGHVPPVRPGGRLRIAHFICSLSSGGAERQLCNLAVMQKRAGHQVRVLLEFRPSGRSGHYVPLLEAAGIRPEVVGAVWSPEILGRWSERAEAAMPLLPRDLREPVMDLAAELLLAPADVLHCWLDRPNVAGLIAARMAGIPAVLLSLRNLSPQHSPHWLSMWMRPWYRVGSTLTGVGLAANAAAGARDYERWLELPSGRIEVLRNAFVPPPEPSAAEVAALRRELGLSGKEPVLAGVFRLDPEKRPLFFLDLVDRLRRLVPGLRVLLAGCGTLEKEVHREWQRRRLQGVVHLLGQRRDVPAILAASSVMLLVSEAEGTPNVSLEAQYLGCVPVVTDVGGSGETIVPNETGLLLAADDDKGLVQSVAGLFTNPDRREAMARKGRDWVLSQFNPGRVYEQTQATYAALLESPHEVCAA